MRLHHRSERAIALGALALALAAPATDALASGNPKNGLSSHAFRTNALTTNKQALAKLAQNPLSQGLLDDPYIKRQLHDPGARAVMEELIKCGLRADASRKYVDPFDGAAYAWQGELGLCQSPETGDWGAQAPTAACQELVTACLMARVNALGVAIPISLRGEPAAVFQLQPKVEAEPTYRESPRGEDPSHGTRIPSFDAGWTPAFVGKCEPGAKVGLTVTAAGGAQLRACGGIHGCEPAGSALMATPRTYLTYLSEFATPAAPATFTAPKSSTFKLACPSAPGVAGFFSLMVRAPRMAKPPAVLAAGATYPAPEAQVFAFLEGAFYGNLFEPGALAKDCEVSADGSQLACKLAAANTQTCAINGDCFHKAGEVPYQSVYACYAARRPFGVAYLNSRLCNIDSPKFACFPNPPRPCSGEPSPPPCEWVAEGGLLKNCRGPAPATRKFRPITTYLNEPCDLIGPDACHKLGNALSPAVGSPAVVVPPVKALPSKILIPPPPPQPPAPPQKAP